MSIPFPPPRRVNGRLYWTRAQIEDHKAKLMGLPAPERGSAPIELVTAAQVTKEFSFTRRTLGRRLVEKTPTASEPTASTAA